MSSEIVIIKNNKIVTTSLIVAEMFEKEHKNVLRDIQELNCSAEFSRLNFEQREYEVRGRNYPMYEMTRDGFTRLVMGFKGEKAAIFIEHFINRFNKMEDMLKSDDYIINRAFALLSEKTKLLEESINQKTEQIAIMHPKVEYVDKVLNSENAMNIGTIAKDLGMSAIALNQILHERGIQYRSSDGLWILYAKYQNKGYTKIETETRILGDGRVKTFHHTKWTERGKAFINWIVNPTINKKPPTDPPNGLQTRT